MLKQAKKEFVKCVECERPVEGFRDNSNVCERCFRDLLEVKLEG